MTGMQKMYTINKLEERLLSERKKAVIKDLKKQLRDKDNQLLLLETLLESIEKIIDGKQVSDFELSFPIVRKVDDLVYELNRFHAKGLK